MTGSIVKASIFSICVLVLACGCQSEPEISQYQVDKENRTTTALDATAEPPASGEPSRMLGLILPHGQKAWFVKAMGPAEKVAKLSEPFRELAASITFDKATGQPSWELPAGWQQVANKNSMRFASLEADGIDVSVSSLDMAADDLKGYVLMNLNRWRGQLNLPPTDLDSLDESVAQIEIGDNTGHLVDITGLSAGNSQPPFAGPHSAPAQDQAGGAPASSSSGSTAAGVPDSWQPGRAGSMRFASYVVRRDDKEAEITVIPLGPAAGGLAANVNRWREQIGLPAATEASIRQDVEEMSVDGTDAEYIKIEDSQASQSVLVVIVKRPDRTWFIKMMGDDALVKAETKNFEDYCRAIDLP